MINARCVEGLRFQVIYVIVNMKNLFAKILLVQGAIKPIVKDETNPFFKSKFFNIDTVIEALRPIINQHGLVVMQPLTNLDGKPAISTLLADPISGEMFESVTPLIETPDIQKHGGNITYTRRYALGSIFLLQGEEDTDGNQPAKTPPSAVKAATGGKECVICGNQFVPNPQYPYAKTCSAICGAEAKKQKALDQEIAGDIMSG